LPLWFSQILEQFATISLRLRRSPDVPMTAMPAIAAMSAIPHDFLHWRSLRAWVYVGFVP
jgi:hypothetical protein